jgi:hypothetical protein
MKRAGRQKRIIAWKSAHVSIGACSDARGSREGVAVMKNAGWLTLAGMLIGAAPVHAAPLVSEDFAYPDGPLAGQNGGTGWNGSWTSSGANVIGGEANVPVSSVSVRPATATLWAADGDAAYASFRMRSTDASGPVVFLLAPFGSGVNWGAGFNGSSFDFNGVPAFGTFNTNQDYLFVMRLVRNDAGNDTATLWIDPLDESDAPQATASEDYLHSGTTALATLRLLGSGGAAIFDDFRIGTTFADVSPVPEASHVLLAAVGALALAGFARRRFSAAA